jgi:hypothetical protein
MSPSHESLPRRMAREYLIHRLGGRPHGHGSYWGRARYPANWVRSHHHRGPFGTRRSRSNVQVRGCGCCLPIPLTLATGAGLALRVGLRSA